MRHGGLSGLRERGSSLVNNNRPTPSPHTLQLVETEWFNAEAGTSGGNKGVRGERQLEVSSREFAARDLSWCRLQRPALKKVLRQRKFVAPRRRERQEVGIESRGVVMRFFR